MRAKILVIEDERATRDSISFFLLNQGYNVITASNGKIALEEIERCRDVGCTLSLIILDLCMPVMSGEEFLAQSAKFATLPPIIVMTGCLEEFSLDNPGSAVPAVILRKPFREEDLIKAVQNLLEQEENNDRLWLDR